MGKLETNARELKRRRQSIRRTSEQSVVDLLRRYGDYKIRSAGLVVGSMTDADSIANPHIRAHALEGRLFRTTLAAALQSHGIHSMIFTERDAYATGAKALDISSAQIKRVLVQLGDETNGPWRAEQKLAALAAWASL